MKHRYSIFTKPFKKLSAEQLGEKVRSLGFDAIEYPLRDGYQVEPANAEAGMPKLAETLGSFGITISSVATATDERCFAGVAAAGCKILRIMANYDGKKPYHAWESEFRKYLDTLVPLARRHGVTVGIQNHYGYGASGTMELYRLVEDRDPKEISAIWDVAHSGLAGEKPDQALSIIYDRMCLVNFKNAYNKRVNGPEAPQSEWKPYFTLGCHGQAHYPRIAAWLREHGYKGDVCLPAEYSDEALVDKLIPVELAYVKSLMEGEA